MTGLNLTGAIDSGCEVSPSCFECPLRECKYDNPLWYLDWKRRKRRELVKNKISANLPLHSKTKAVSIVAGELGISTRSVYRIDRPL